MTYESTPCGGTPAGLGPTEVCECDFWQEDWDTFEILPYHFVHDTTAGTYRLIEIT